MKKCLSLLLAALMLAAVLTGYVLVWLFYAGLAV